MNSEDTPDEAPQRGYTIMNNLGEIWSHPVPQSCLWKIRSRDKSKGGWWEVTKIVGHRMELMAQLSTTPFLLAMTTPSGSTRLTLTARISLQHIGRPKGKL